MSEIRPAAMRERRDIEWLVNWALEKQGLGRRDGEGSSGGLGVKVDSSHYRNDGKWVSEDAQVIHDQLQLMIADKRTAAAASLVAHYGRTGMRPDWGKDGSGRWQLVRRNEGTGAARRRYDDQRKGNKVIGFEFEWVGNTVEEMERMMLEWLAWHAALDDLKNAINSKLRDYVATGPAVQEAPWDMPAVMVHHADGRSVEAR